VLAPYVKKYNKILRVVNLAKGMDDRLAAPIQRGMHKEGIGIA